MDNILAHLTLDGWHDHGLDVVQEWSLGGLATLYNCTHTCSICERRSSWTKEDA
jgi:hypothetical protein